MSDLIFQAPGEMQYWGEFVLAQVKNGMATSQAIKNADLVILESRKRLKEASPLSVVQTMPPPPH